MHEKEKKIADNLAPSSVGYHLCCNSPVVS